MKKQQNNFTCGRGFQVALSIALLFISTVLLASSSNATPFTFGNTGSLGTLRAQHTATLLPNGKVLVAGGIDSSFNPLASAELYDPATGTWTATGSLVTARYSHTATLLPNGKVLVSGGFNSSVPLASAELYDPASGTWTATGSLSTARRIHTATLLPNGKVLVSGGFNSSG
jgi:N-acetylneuraminic acid mutarotase